MLPLLTKHTIMTAALAASLSITACGKKTDSVVTPPEEVKTAEPAKVEDKGVAAQTPGKATDTNGTLGGGLPDPQSRENDYFPPTPEPGALPKTPKAPTPPPIKKPILKPAVTPPVEKSVEKPVAKPPVAVEAKPAVKAPGVEIDQNTYQVPESYKSNDPKYVTTDNIAKRFTGGAGQDGLLYTSSSTDTLISYLRARNYKVDHATRRLNLEAAASVMSAKMTVEPLSKDTVVTLKIKEGGNVNTYVMVGVIGEGEVSRLYKARESSSGYKQMEGTAKCMDLDGGCQTTFVRLKIGSAGSSSAIINVVFRQSVADVHFDFAKEQSNNNEFIYIRDFFQNAILRVPNIDNKFKIARMSSYEVVNGKSEVTLSMKGYNNELLAFNAPLLAPQVGTGVSIPVSRVAKMNEDSGNLFETERASLNYANTIGSARMVANNGLGQVKIVLKMRQNSNHPQDQFMVTFMRKIKPLIDLNDENMK